MSTNENLGHCAAKRRAEHSDSTDPFSIQNRMQPISKLLDGSRARIRRVNDAMIFAHSHRELETEVIHQLASGKKKNSSYPGAKNAVLPSPAALLRYGPEAIESGLLVHL
jgi:hypothetical protein